MAERVLRLFTDTFAAKARGALSAANRMIYVVSGIVDIEVGASVVRLNAGSSAFLPDPTALGAATDGTEVLRWELVGQPESEDGLLRSPGASSKRTLDARISVDDTMPWLMRLDTVELPAGGKAPMHTHQGPGIRCLLDGGFTVETQGHTGSYRPGEAWFETGPDPVVAWAPDDKPAKFARVMLLPHALLGKQSTRYVQADPVVATRGRRWIIHLDRAITP
jgi:hypothetical protein